ncbi:hypothetical protein AB0P36_32565 [Streptomyces flavidovirens]|uniref:hypothetical protein n=1 Tax=Streptomyces flavidovirens TaxID=67298 RepID=UPI00342BE213
MHDALGATARAAQLLQQPEGRRGPSSCSTTGGAGKCSVGTASYVTPSTGPTYRGNGSHTRYSTGSTSPVYW